MAKIIAPNKDYCGISCGVTFVNGEGSTNNEYALKWFENHGYTVREETKNSKIKE